MEIEKYSKKTWIAVLVIAVISVLVDVLILTKVIDAGDDAVQSTSVLTLVIGIVGLYYGIRGIAYYNKKDKEK